MWFVLLFGIIDLVAAGLFARRPEPGRLRFIWAMGFATLFSILSGTASAVAAVCTHVPANPEWANSPSLHLILLTGLGECMSAGVLGFSLLSLVAFVAAIGLRRMPRSPSP